MNRKKACAILELNVDANYTESELKKQYRSKMLQYHPDKNKSPDATAKCIEAQDAYNYLRSSDEPEVESYDEMLKSFLQSVFREDANIPPLISKIFEVICKKIIEYNADAIIDYLRNINSDILRVLHSILSKYRHILHFSEDIFCRIDELLNANECIIVNATLDDLFYDENVYILKHNTTSYLVPLWHHGMTFDCSLSDTSSKSSFVVNIIPLLPDNMELDECNRLTVWLNYNVVEIWNQEKTVDIGGVPFVIRGKELKMTDQPQKIEYTGCGVPYNNTEDIFNCSQKQSVTFIVRIVGP